jgi:hypothetical protein
VAGSVFAQSNNGSNIFALDHTWLKIVGYSYQPAYPTGFSLAGGSFLSVGWGEDGKQYTISATEYREPTWSLRCGWIGYNFSKATGWKAITFRPMLVMGMNKTKDYTYNTAKDRWEGESNTYFTMAPTLVVNCYFVHFSLGYEYVPKFKEMNGFNFGVGFSIPLNTDNLEKKANEWSDNQKKNKKSKQF